MRIAILLTACLLLSGCGDSGTSTVQTPEPPSQKPVDPKTAKPVTSAATVTATVKTAEEVDQLIASFRGKFVVMDLWAMW
jgi:ABC-type uncharacterized transport system auxiliary subunit